MLSRLFRSDFTDYKVIETKEFNSCGENINTLYHIEFARYIFGIKIYIEFYEVVGGWGDIYHRRRVSPYQDVILKEYKDFVKALTIFEKKTVVTTVVTAAEKICD